MSDKKKKPELPIEKIHVHENTVILVTKNKILEIDFPSLLKKRDSEKIHAKAFALNSFVET